MTTRDGPAGMYVMLALLVGALVLAIVLFLNPPPRDAQTPTPVQPPAAHDPAAFDAEWAKLDSDVEPAGGFRVAPGLPPPRLYPPVELVKVAAKGGWVRPRALLRGTVVLARTEDDGDYHFALADDAGNRVVCEVVPELPLPRPKVGQQVVAWGVVRWDGEHGWGELHPVIGWKEEGK